MDKSTFVSKLENDKDRILNREALVSAVISNPDYIDILLSNMAKIVAENSNFSARILELVCKKNTELLLPYLDRFCQLLPIINQKQTIRASAKICEIMVIKYFNNRPVILLESHLNKIIESGFDWLIADNKTAVKAYTMHTLFIIGRRESWIHSELISNIEKDIPNGTVGYVNRGRKIIKAIESKKNFKL